MGNFPDIEIASSDNVGALDLLVAFQAEIVVPFNQESPVDRTVWIVASGAPVTQRFVFENKWTGLFAMTLGATLIETRHGESA